MTQRFVLPPTTDRATREGFRTLEIDGIRERAVGNNAVHYGKFYDNGGAVINVKHPDYGAVGDGTTDDTTAIQAAIAAMTDGSAILFPAGTYVVSSTLTLSSLSDITLIFEGGVLEESTVLSTPVLTLSSCSGVVIRGARITGAEDSSNFDGASSNRSGIYLASCTDVSVSDVFISGKSWGIEFLSTNRACVRNAVVQGFGVNGVSGLNSHSGVRVRSCTEVSVVDSFFRGIGSGVLGQGDSVRCSVIGCKINDFYDNGIYVSSGFEWAIIGNGVYDNDPLTGDGIQVRGTNHTVVGNTVERSGSGIRATGNGTADNYGTNGAGIVIQGNVIETVVNDGIGIGGQDGYYGRQFIVDSNVIRDSATSGGGYAAIRGWAQYSTISNNMIEDCNGTTGAIVLGWSSQGGAGEASAGYGMRVIGNHILDSAGDGIFISDCSRCQIVDNFGEDIDGDDFIDANNVDSSVISRNFMNDSANVLNVDSSCGDLFIEHNNSRKGTLSHQILGSGHTVHITDYGDPESNVVASVGSTFARKDGGAGTTLYVKESGSGATGWAGV